MSKEMQGQDEAYMSGYMAGQNNKQPEIDALKMRVENYKQYAEGVSIQLSQANKEVNALKEERDHVYSLLRGRTPAQCDLLSLEIASLKARIERMEGQRKVEEAVTEAAIAQIETLKAENERLRKDAERYRWLKNNCFDYEDPAGNLFYASSDLTQLADSLDTFIDREIKDFSTTTKEE